MSQSFIGPLNPPLKPRDGRTLRVLVMTRISTENQDRRSLDDQAAFCRRYVAENHAGAADFHVLQHQASGELVERPDLVEAERLIKSRAIDWVIAEDLGRIMRRHNVYTFLEFCEDHQTRLIAINDNVDTALEWRTLTTISSLRHEMHNADTSKRIRRSLDNRFTQGGTLSCHIYGYIKEPGAKTEDGLRKDLDAQPIYEHWFNMLEEGASYSEVADSLNDKHVPTGPTCRASKWNAKMVSRVTHNPIIKGLRQRGRRITRRRNSTGQHYTVKAPAEHLKERHCPHLVFIEPERYDRVVAMLDACNSKYRRGKNGIDPMASRAKKRTTWPGQSICCGVCGRTFVWGGHGRTNHLMCAGAKDYRCWNGVSFGGRQAAKKIADAVLDAVEGLPDFEPGFRAMVQQKLAELSDTVDQRKRELARRRNDTDKKLQNLMNFIMNGGDQELALAQQETLKAEKAEIDIELARLEKAVQTQPVLPDIDQIKQMARDLFQNLAVNDQAFARKLRQLIPLIHVVPVRCINGGHPLLRARFELRLGRLFDGIELLDQVDQHLTRHVEVDLFDPPQHVAYLADILDFKKRIRPDGKPYTEYQIADALGVTQPRRAVRHEAAPSHGLPGHERPVRSTVRTPGRREQDAPAQAPPLPVRAATRTQAGRARRLRFPGHRLCRGRGRRGLTPPNPQHKETP